MKLILILRQVDQRLWYFRIKKAKVRIQSYKASQWEAFIGKWEYHNKGKEGKERKENYNSLCALCPPKEDAPSLS